MIRRKGEDKDFEEKPRQPRISFKQNEAAGRKTVIILFLITFGLSLVFWLKQELPGFLRNAVGPYQMTIEKSP